MRSHPGSIPRSLETLFRRWGLAAVGDPHELKGQRGHYVLLLRVPAGRFTIGALGSLRLAAGLYGYVGSARGRSVTLGHRLARHMRRRKVRRWHIDYLTTAPAVTMLCAYWTADPTMTETGLAIRCAERFPVIRRFGNADVRGGAPGISSSSHRNDEGPAMKIPGVPLLLLFLVLLAMLPFRRGSASPARHLKNRHRHCRHRRRGNFRRDRALRNRGGLFSMSNSPSTHDWGLCPCRRSGFPHQPSID